MATAIGAVWDAIGAAIDAGVGPPLELATPRFYRDGEVPEDARLGYYLLGGPLEDPGGFYGQPGNSGAYAIHCWAGTLSQAVRLYKWLEGLLQGSRLPYDGHAAWQCTVRVSGSGKDATSEARQIIARVELETVVA